MNQRLAERQEEKDKLVALKRAGQAKRASSPVPLVERSPSLSIPGKVPPAIQKAIEKMKKQAAEKVEREAVAARANITRVTIDLEACPPEIAAAIQRVRDLQAQEQSGTGFPLDRSLPEEAKKKSDQASDMVTSKG